MATKDFIAAIELSSSRVSGIAGRRTSEGGFEVLAYAGVSDCDAVHKGIVLNVDKAAQAITTVVGQLEQQLGSRIARVYTGIGGQSLCTVENRVSRQLTEEGVIDQKLVDEICDENLQVPLAGMDVLDVAPQEWRIDHHTQAEPVGVVGRNEVTATFLNVVARSELKHNLELAFGKAGLEKADHIVTPLATALAALQESEKRAGCALVDLGADTTTVAIYRSGMLRYLAVLPLGGNHITRDLTTLRIMDQEAEQLKCQYGDALYVEPDSQQPSSCQTADGRPIALADLCNIVGARAEEILANVLHQISLSGYENDLLSGIVLTGGASALRDLEEALRRLGKGRADKVKTVSTPQVKLTGRTDLLPNDGTTIALVGLMMHGHEDCRRPDEPQTEAPEVHLATDMGAVAGSRSMAADFAGPSAGDASPATTFGQNQSGPVRGIRDTGAWDTGAWDTGTRDTSTQMGSTRQDKPSSQEPRDKGPIKKKPGKGDGKAKEKTTATSKKKFADFVGRLFGDDEEMTNL